MTTWETAVAAAPVVAVVRHRDTDVAERIARAAAEGGIELIEITFTVPSAARLIERLSGDLPHAVVGAGTVLTEADLAIAADAGAAFLVSPVVDPRLMEFAAARSVSFIPGAATPTEVARAAAAGATTVKLFPASGLGVGFVSAVHDVLPGVSLLPTGGIGVADIATWLSAGAAAVGLGGALNSAWNTGGASAVRLAAQEALSATQSVRSHA